MLLLQCRCACLGTWVSNVLVAPVCAKVVTIDKGVDSKHNEL
jgi:hypothetical protein